MVAVVGAVAVAAATIAEAVADTFAYADNFPGTDCS